MRADGFVAAKELAAVAASACWQAWPGVARAACRLGQLEGEPELGGSLRLRAEVSLDGLSPDDVCVEAVYGPGRRRRPARRHDSGDAEGCIETADGTLRYEGDVPLERTGAFGYTVRVLPQNDLLATPSRARRGRHRMRHPTKALCAFAGTPKVDQ